MLDSRVRSALLGLGLTALLLPAFGRAQERDLVSKEVAVGSSEAALRLEFSDGDRLEISLRDGAVIIDGDAVGTFEAGGSLESAWRSLLGDAVALDDGPLSRMLREWAPPAELDRGQEDIAELIDEALEASLGRTALSVQTEGSRVSVSLGGDEGDLVQALLGHVSRLGVLEEALDDLGDDIQLHVGDDVDVGADDRIEGTLVVIGADVVVEGVVTGDVVLVDGTLELEDGGEIRGDVRLADADVVRNGGELDGTILDLVKDDRDQEAELRRQLRSELRSELRDEIQHTNRSGGGGFMSPLSNLFRALGGIVESLVLVFVLGVVGMGIVAFAGENLDVVAETARRAPGRAGMVGLAGSFLMVPVWLLGTLALAVSIVGIPVMIAWVPLFPLAAAAAGVLGYLAVARNVGEWLADSNYRFTDWIRKSSPVHTVFGGLLGFMIFFMAAHALSIVPLVGMFGGMLRFAGTVVSFVALQVGFGAVLLTRAGRRREYYPDDFDEAWDRAVNVDVDEEVETAAEADADDGEKADA